MWCVVLCVLRDLTRCDPFVDKASRQCKSPKTNLHVAEHLGGRLPTVSLCSQSGHMKNCGPLI